MSSYPPPSPTWPGAYSAESFQSSVAYDEADFGVDEADLDVDDTEVYNTPAPYSQLSMSLHQPQIFSGYSTTSTFPDYGSANRSFVTFGDDFTGGPRPSDGTHTAYTLTTPTVSRYDAMSGHTQYHGMRDHSPHQGSSVQGRHPSRQESSDEGRYPSQQDPSDQGGYSSPRDGTTPSRSATWSSYSSTEPNQGSVFGDDEDDRREARQRDASEQRDAFERHGVQVPVGARYTIDPHQMFEPEITPEEASSNHKRKEKSRKKPERTYASHSRPSGRRNR